MDLTSEYINFILKNTTREKIVNNLDCLIEGGLCLTDDVLDLALSTYYDDYEFGKSLLRFVVLPLPKTTVLESIELGLNRYLTNGNIDMIEGLRLLRNNFCVHEDIVDLYYVLDHYWIEEPEWTSRGEIDKYIMGWLADAIYTKNVITK